MKNWQTYCSADQLNTTFLLCFLVFEFAKKFVYLLTDTAMNSERGEKSLFLLECGWASFLLNLHSHPMAVV